MILNFRFARALVLFLLCLWSVFFFYYLGWKPGFAYNAQRYFQIFLIGCLLCAGVGLPVRFYFGRLWSCLIFSIVLIMVLVVLLAENRWMAVRETMQFVALFAAILVVAKARHQAGAFSFDRAAYIGLTILCFGCSLIIVEGLLLSLSIGLVDQRIIFGAFVNIRIFAELQFLTLFLLPAAWIHMDSIGWRRFISMTAMLWWGLLLFTGTRSALAALPFALLMLAVIGGKQTYSWLRLLARQFIGGLLVFGVISLSMSLTLGTSLLGEGGMSFARTSSGGRLEIWANTWQYFLQSPWFGNGPGAFACLTDELVASPHNLGLQLLSEWGLFMAMLCLVIALLLFYSLVRFLRSERRPSAVHFSLFATLVATVAASMMEGMIIAPLQQMLLVLLFGWSLHAFAPDKFVSLTENRGSRLKLGFAAVLCAFLAVVLWGMKADLALQRQLLVSPEGVVNLSYGPRFWADGHDHCQNWHERFYGR